MKRTMSEIPRNPENLCIHEQIVPFTGGMPNKVVIKPKPYPVGLKLFCLVDPSGTILNFIPYTGARTFEGKLAAKPQGEAAVRMFKKDARFIWTVFQWPGSSQVSS